VGERGVAYRALARRPDEIVHLVRPRRRREKNIKMDLQGIEWGAVDWIWLRIGVGRGLL
jgi:hypothetical protein